ncbi:proteasome endopeptidase complex [Malassezia psittaci]|uniref:Proteasome subunit alpha type n=1 Tax=Malassezia psittaci TaxID=1821823 RepID=A0AAF0F9Z2_9BASI|nr:proteasome endopeptidase complex [Malassezia psittaci]
MASQGTGYDLSASTYSPDGRIFQIEYATKAVENAGTAIALRTKDGVVFAVENLVPSKLLVPGSNRRIFTVADHVGLTSAGLTADGKHLAGRARDEASNFFDNYHQAVPIKTLAERVALYVQAFTLYSSVRPFGISSILGGVDKERGPQLFVIEPSGVFWGYHGCAIGKGKQFAKTEIEKLALDTLTMEEAVEEVARIIYKAHDDAKDKEFELQLSWVGPATSNEHEPVPRELHEQAVRKAQQALEEEMED